MLENEFNTFLKQKTRLSFHDASLSKISFLSDHNDSIIEIVIEHNIDGENEYQEKVLLGVLTFFNVKKINLLNEVEYFLVDNEISSFDVATLNDNTIFAIVGIKGWKLTFSASEFKYSDSVKEILNLY